MSIYESQLNILLKIAKLKKENIPQIVELIERATPKKLKVYIEDNIEWLQCPICSGDTTDDQQFAFNYCPNCGQALDWSE